MDRLFDLEDDEICNDVADNIDQAEQSIESIRDLILQFWYQQLHFICMVCCDLAETGTCSINC